MILRQFRCILQKRRFLILIFIVVMLFLINQLLSVGQLGKEPFKKRTRAKLQTNFKSYEKADSFMQIKYPDEEKHRDSLWHGEEEWNENVRNVLGVKTENQKFYFPTAKNTFKCIKTGEEISFSWVNDNYCDCSDFSDEPSTPACSFGRFYCTLQSKHSPISIMSSKVNDGICDCCDGSDEWEKLSLPEHTKLSVNKQKGIYQVPCKMRCTL